jgi:hypothetical protein
LLPAAVASKLAESMAHPELSERERQVLQCMANGRSNKEIEQVLYQREHGQGSREVYPDKVRRDGPYRSDCHRSPARTDSVPLAPTRLLPYSPISDGL